MGNFPFAPNPALALQAATPLAGYTLVNGTGTVISWAVPNDGKLHRVLVTGSILVTVTEVGGLIQLGWTAPGGAAQQFSQLAAAALASSAAGQVLGTYELVVAPGTTVTVAQNSALTVGAATLWAEIWGS